MYDSHVSLNEERRPNHYTQTSQKELNYFHIIQLHNTEFASCTKECDCSYFYTKKNRNCNLYICTDKYYHSPIKRNMLILMHVRPLVGLI